jgi:hypothetical protein
VVQAIDVECVPKRQFLINLKFHYFLSLVRVEETGACFFGYWGYWIFDPLVSIPDVVGLMGSLGLLKEGLVTPWFFGWSNLVPLATNWTSF